MIEQKESTEQQEHMVPLSQRHPSMPPRWRWWLAEFHPGMLIIVLFVFLIGGFIWLQVSRANRRIVALQSPPQNGYALVTNKQSSPGSRHVGPPLNVSFDLQGHYVRAITNDPVKFQQTVVGDTVPVTYHVDKDGSFYIEDWQPTVIKQKLPLKPH